MVTAIVSEKENFIKYHIAANDFNRVFWVPEPLSYFVFYREIYNKYRQICIPPFTAFWGL